jgi:isoleucyl-tRNA synthetase
MIWRPRQGTDCLILNVTYGQDSFDEDCATWAEKICKTQEQNIAAGRFGNGFFQEENFRHSYPHCWRCDTPLLNTPLRHGSSE